MRKLFDLAAAFSILLLSCHKDSTTTDWQPANTLVGKWSLTETLADPGNGSGTWMPITGNIHYYITFLPDSTVNTTISSGVGDLNRYSVTNDSTVNFIYGSGNVITHRFTIRDNVLTITGGCIEACGSRFSRVLPM